VIISWSTSLRKYEDRNGKKISYNIEAGIGLKRYKKIRREGEGMKNNKCELKYGIKLK